MTLLYVPWIHYQTILVQAFGVGGFRMVPKRPARQQGNVFTWEGSLWVRPKGSKKFQFVDEAVGECGIQSAGNGPEGAKSDCLTKCCKRLNIFMELFDPAWRRWWEGNYKGTHQAAKGKRAWVERGRAGAAESPSAPSSSAPTAAPSGRTTAPAADAPDSDTGEAASDESKAAIRAEVKRRKWTPSYARLWLQRALRADVAGRAHAAAGGAGAGQGHVDDHPAGRGHAVTVARERVDKLRAAGVVLHQYYRRAGLYTRAGFAVCGARRDQGAEFSTWAKYVSCAECKAVIAGRRAAAKERFRVAGGAP
jgi:hypothetical protein